jgi:hypothetical protein
MESNITFLVAFVAEGYIAFHYWLRFVRGLVLFVTDGYIAVHYCLRFTTDWFPLLQMAILLSIIVHGLTQRESVLRQTLNSHGKQYSYLSTKGTSPLVNLIQ